MATIRTRKASGAAGAGAPGACCSLEARTAAGEAAAREKQAWHGGPGLPGGPGACQPTGSNVHRGQQRRRPQPATQRRPGGIAPSGAARRAAAGWATDSRCVLERDASMGRPRAAAHPCRRALPPPAPAAATLLPGLRRCGCSWSWLHTRQGLQLPAEYQPAGSRRWPRSSLPAALHVC